MKKIRLFIVGLFVGLLTLGVGASFIVGKRVSSVLTKAEDSMIWYHYNEVAPTTSCHGSKEFWANCTTHTFSLEEPESSNILEGVDFSTTAYFFALEENDLRYIERLKKDCGVKFYCDDLLISSFVVKEGSLIEAPSSDDFQFNDWYLEKDLVNLWDFSTPVTSDLNLYADYVGLEKSFSFSDLEPISLDENGFGVATNQGKIVCVSKGRDTTNYFATIHSRGIMFNKDEIGLIDFVEINISVINFVSAKIYYGNTPLSFDYSCDLSIGQNLIQLNGFRYFTIQNTGPYTMNVSSLNVGYVTNTHILNDSLPSVVINTENEESITSRTDYINCDVSTDGGEKDVENLVGKIKVRGNSTALMPKLAYRIKLDKKASIFGYEKAKNWVLLADYMDGSKMHNYTALKFTEMLRNGSSFAAKPMHVNLILNGNYVGLYEFCEHIDAKEGRLNLEHKKIWEKSFDEINFYIERDDSTLTDPTEIEGETYFTIDLPDNEPNKYVFALKYPEKEDFEEELKDKTIVPHADEFYSFFNSLKDYIGSICNAFTTYVSTFSNFNDISELVDVSSLASYAAIDQVFAETDHALKSFKMYRENGGLIKFGPNWDYDSCVYGLPYKGTYVNNPFENGHPVTTTTFSEPWGYALFNDLENGRPLFASIWSNISNDAINSFLESQYEIMKKISYSCLEDCGLWMKNQYHSLFDNQLYYWEYISQQLLYLKEFYAGQAF